MELDLHGQSTYLEIFYTKAEQLDNQNGAEHHPVGRGLCPAFLPLVVMWFVGAWPHKRFCLLLSLSEKRSNNLIEEHSKTDDDFRGFSDIMISVIWVIIAPNIPVMTQFSVCVKYHFIRPCDGL
jgi:hypothetical protein